MMKVSEKDLIDNGFTESEVKKLKEKIKKGEEAGEEETLLTMIIDLKKRFKVNIFIITLTILISPLAIDYKDSITIKAYIVTFLILLIILQTVNPIILSAKAYFFLKKKGL